MRLLSRKHRKALCGAKVLALGVAYKNDIDDCRESPAIRVLKLLREEGAEVTYFDPWVAQYKEDGQVYYSEKELTPELVQAADLVIVNLETTLTRTDRRSQQCGLCHGAEECQGCFRHQKRDAQAQRFRR